MAAGHFAAAGDPAVAGDLADVRESRTLPQLENRRR